MNTRKERSSPARAGLTAQAARLGAAVLLWACAGAGTAFAHHGGEYPAHPIRMVSPYPPGGPVDTFGRLVANKASEALKQTIVFENRPGASGLIAGEHVAKSAGDGYTLLVSVPSLFTIVPHMIEGASARIEGLVPVAQFAVAPLVLVVHPSVEAKNVKELVSLLKAPSATLDYASAGNGTLPHLAMELLLASVNGKAVHVPHKGSGPAAADLVGGQVKAMMDNMSSSLPHARSGKLRALAVTSGKRFAGAPDIPTLAESGVEGYEVNNWFGVFAPAGTPAAVVEKLNGVFAKAAFAPDVSQRLGELGAVPVSPKPAEISALIKRESEQWGRIIRRAGIKRN
ncbi:MAG TPA: tripartite tricarboxylate transporter substrate binding protein [Burkholderiales bacterium]|nr:tripartite tricarboxylate transporter substrate binding protein [Burkholderiales bacterium]